MFHRTLLDPQLFPRFFDIVSYTCTWRLPLPQLLHSSMSRSTATLQGGFCFGRLADPLLTGCEPQSLIDVTLDASEVCDATNVGRWTSLLFSKARRKCYSFRGLLSSDTLKRGQIQVRCWAVFKLPETGRKVKEIEIWRVCRILKWKGKDICPNKEAFTISLKAKLIMLFKKNAQVRQDYLKHCPNWTDENGRCRVLTELNMKTGMRLQPQRMELYQAHAGCVTNCKMRNRAFQEDCARNCQEVEELRRILLYRGWKSSTIDERWTFYVEGRK